MRAAIEAVAEKARWVEWRAVRAPTLLVSGQNGTMGPAELSRMLAMRPDVSHVVIPDAGHDAHLDRPAEWSSLLRGFLGVPDHITGP
jgi:pimeloyl-ACP methyl ester carboxylesterase